QKASGINEGTSTIPGVPDVPIYDSKSDKESWGDSDEEDDFKDDANNDNGSSDDHDDDSDEKRTKSNRDEIPDSNLTNVDQIDHEEEDVDKRVHTPLDYELTDDEKIHDEENIYEEEEDEVTKELYDDVNSGFEQEEEDAHVKLTPVHDAQKTGGPTQSSSVSSDFTSKLLNLNNPSPVDNEIDSLMDTKAYHAKAIPKITSTVTLSEFELTKILIDKMERNKSFNVADYKRELYDALAKSYNTNKDIFESYGEVFSLKRIRDDKDKYQDPSVGSDRGTKRRKSSKDVVSSIDSSKSAHAEEPSHIIEDSGMQQDQEFIMRDNDKQLADKEVTKAEWFKKPERPPTPDPNWSK
nr:hypothetical protein [Tanacetum cinerariifolium]